MCRNGRGTLLAILGVLACTAVQPAAGRAQEFWLDEAKPAGWNEPRMPVPDAPAKIEAVDPHCRDLARPAELAQDSQAVAAGWDLVGGYHGGWDVVVVRGTANYGGMCRPWQYQAFVFVNGVFAGTLSPHTMNSRTDGALGRVWIQDAGRITAQYHRYTDEDPLCCPSRTTSVEFDVTATNQGPVVNPSSTYTSATSNR